MRFYAVVRFGRQRIYSWRLSQNCRKDVDFLERTITVRQSKTDAGRRVIPLNDIGWDAIIDLYHRAQKVAGTNPDNYVFPACENGNINPATPQKSWRSAWRSLKKAAGIRHLRFHDLRHHAITELAESDASEQTIMSVAGHVSRQMLETTPTSGWRQSAEPLNRSRTGAKQVVTSQTASQQT